MPGFCDWKRPGCFLGGFSIHWEVNLLSTDPFERRYRTALLSACGLDIMPALKTSPNFSGISYSASVDDVVQLWAKERAYVLVCQDMEESYRLEFQTQCPMASVYWSNGPTRNFRIGQSVAYVRHMSAKFLVWAGLPVGCLYRAMQAVTVESV